VSPPGGDFSDPVTSCTLGIAQVFWGLDAKLVQRKHFPSVNIALSYSKYLTVLDEYYEKEHPGFPQLRDKIKQLLYSSDSLKQLIQLVGKATLDDHDRITLDVASLVEEAFLQQNGYSEYDELCPLWKTKYMMKAFMCFRDASQRAISEGHNWAKIKQLTGGISSTLRNMKFEMPDDEDTVPMKVRSSAKCYY
jgi:V-type H+-transporting ATPase subunit A